MSHGDTSIEFRYQVRDYLFNLDSKILEFHAQPIEHSLGVNTVRLTLMDANLLVGDWRSSPVRLVRPPKTRPPAWCANQMLTSAPTPSPTPAATSAPTPAPTPAPPTPIAMAPITLPPAGNETMIETTATITTVASNSQALATESNHSRTAAVDATVAVSGTPSDAPSSVNLGFNYWLCGWRRLLDCVADVGGSLVFEETRQADDSRFRHGNK